MTMHHHGATPTPRQPRRVHAHARTRRTTAPAHPWMYPVPWFLIQFGMPAHLTFGETINDTTGEPDSIYLSAADGSWCEISTDDDGTSLGLWSWKAVRSPCGARSNRHTTNGAQRENPAGDGSD